MIDGVNTGFNFQLKVTEEGVCLRWVDFKGDWLANVLTVNHIDGVVLHDLGTPDGFPTIEVGDADFIALRFDGAKDGPYKITSQTQRQ